MADYRLADKGVIRTKDNAFIPEELANSDYQEYLKWLSEGNRPDPLVIPERTPREKRRSEYPEVQDQLDAVWAGGDAMEAMRARIRAIDDKYPLGASAQTLKPQR